jgi:hypothetical protein
MNSNTFCSSERAEQHHPKTKIDRAMFGLPNARFRDRNGAV